VATNPVAYSRVVANWFDRRRGLALGLSSAGVGVGAFIMPSMAHFLIEEYGWRQAYTALGCASLLIGAPVVALFLRGSPQEVGLSPDGVKETRTHDFRAGHSAGMTVPEALRTLTSGSCASSFSACPRALTELLHIWPRCSPIKECLDGAPLWPRRCSARPRLRAGWETATWWIASLLPTWRRPCSEAPRWDWLCWEAA